MPAAVYRRPIRNPPHLPLAFSGCPALRAPPPACSKLIAPNYLPALGIELLKKESLIKERNLCKLFIIVYYYQISFYYILLGLFRIIYFDYCLIIFDLCCLLIND